MSSVHCPMRVHFPAELAKPPADRRRKKGLVYPKVAQSKDSCDRQSSEDLFWGKRSVASPEIPSPEEDQDAKSPPQPTSPSPVLHMESSPRPRHRRFSLLKTLSAIDHLVSKASPTLPPSPVFAIDTLSPKPSHPSSIPQGDPDLPTPLLVTPTSSESSASSAPDSDRDSFLRNRDAANNVYIHIHTRSDESDF